MILLYCGGGAAGSTICAKTGDAANINAKVEPVINVFIYNSFRFHILRANSTHRSKFRVGDFVNALV
jgi:hypothetical protein